MDNKIKEKLKDKTLALFFTTGISLRTWHDVGMIEREVAGYNRLSKYFKYIYFFTYGGKEELKFKKYLADNIIIVPKKYISNNFLYSFMLPFIHRKILKNTDIFKTNQMSGSWSAVLAKLVYRKKIIIRTGYTLSVFAEKQPKSRKRYIAGHIERIAYWFADGIITNSKGSYKCVNKKYTPSSIHILIPNYVETDVFKPLKVKRKKNSICFIGRLTAQKNLFELINALVGLKYYLTIVGSGEQKEQLKQFAVENKVKVTFLGNVKNHKLPGILNQHELFILPSLWEGMPKTLLEAMACGVPVIGTKVDGINEVIKNNVTGLLCNTDSNSIRTTIINMMDNKMLMQKLGENARNTIVENYSLDKLVKKELKLMEVLA